MNIADELQKLQQLRDSGAISDEEFAQAKAKLLTTPSSGMDALFGSTSTEQRTRQWAMLLHFSHFAGILIPLGGFIVPILIWQIQKEKLPGIDEHGKIVVNWIISSVLYWILSVLLVAVLIGIPMLAVMAVLVVAFPIIGGIKANNGEAWKYPLSIPFFK
jgi:uncharacterized Tic20 family protein